MFSKIYKILFCSIQLPRNVLFALFLLLTVLNVLDAVSTWQVVKRGSYKNEKNPIARKLFKLIGPIPAMILLKGLAIAIIAYIAINYKKFRPDIDTLIILLNTAYIWVVVHNYRVLTRVKNILKKYPDLHIED